MTVREILSWVAGDSQAAKVVPPSGHTARLTVFAAGAMAFLAVFALALSMASGRVASRWSDELARSATLRLPVVAGAGDQTETALRILEQTPGIVRAHALTPEEQETLLSPWFGPDLPLERLPVPQLIEIIEDSAGYDAEGLTARLKAELPGAVLDDHTRWRKPLVAAAWRLRVLGWLSIALIGAATAAMVTLAASAALAANSQVIRVLRLVGARDDYIASAFVRRFTLRALAGAAAGGLAGLAAIALMPDAGDAGGFLTGLGFEGAGWLWALLIPPMAAGVAFLATRRAALRTLRRMS